MGALLEANAACVALFSWGQAVCLSVWLARVVEGDDRLQARVSAPAVGGGFRSVASGGHVLLCRCLLEYGRNPLVSVNGHATHLVKA